MKINETLVLNQGTTNADRRFYIMLIVPPNAYKMSVIFTPLAMGKAGRVTFIVFTSNCKS